jgi:hypothetical protein
MLMAVEIVVGRQGGRGTMTTRSPLELNLSLGAVDNTNGIRSHTAGMMHTIVGQKLLKPNILRLFFMSNYKFLMLLFA